MDWIYRVQDRKNFRDVVNVVINFPSTVERLLSAETDCAPCTYLVSKHSSIPKRLQSHPCPVSPLVIIVLDVLYLAGTSCKYRTSSWHKRAEIRYKDGETLNWRKRNIRIATKKEKRTERLVLLLTISVRLR